jgi:uncharacterized spore protein YtfJ
MFRSLLGKIESHKRNMTETAFGDPMTFSSVTIIPVARVTYATCTGSNDNNERAIASTQPLGYIEVREEGIRFISLFDPTEIVLLGAVCAAGIFSVTHLLTGIHPRPPKTTEKKKEGSEKSGLPKFLSLVGVVASAALIGTLMHIRCSHMKETDHCLHHGNVEDEYISAGEMEREKSRQRSSLAAKPGNDIEDEWDIPGIKIIDETMKPED